MCLQAQQRGRKPTPTSQTAGGWDPLSWSGGASPFSGLFSSPVSGILNLSDYVDPPSVQPTTGQCSTPSAAPGLQSNYKVPVINTRIVSVTTSLNKNVNVNVNMIRLDVLINELWTMMNLMNYDELNELWTMNCYELGNCDLKCCEGSKVLCCMCACHERVSWTTKIKS